MRISLRRSGIEKLIGFFIIFQLVIDTINGFFVLKLGVDIRISVIYKLILLTLCVFYIFGIDKNKKIILYIFLYIWFILSIHFLYPNHDIVNDMLEMIKLITTFVVFFALSNFKYSNPFFFLKRWLLVGVLVLFFNLFMSFVGFGTYSYGSYGFKGFFYAANALSGVIFIFSSLALILAIRKSIMLFILTAMSYLIIAILVGTKSGIISVYLSINIIAFIFFSYRVKFVFLSLFGFCLVYFISNNIEAILSSEIFLRLIYFYDTGGMIRAVFSDRHEFFNEIIPVFFDSNTLVLLFGMGFGELNLFNKPLVEIDFIDIVTLYGILTIVLYFLLLIFILNLISKVNVTNNIFIKQLVLNSYFTTFILLLISSFAGHIIFNGVTTIPWAVSLSIPIWLYNFNSRYREQNV